MLVLCAVWYIGGMNRLVPASDCLMQSVSSVVCITLNARLYRHV